MFKPLKNSTHSKADFFFIISLKIMNNSDLLSSLKAKEEKRGFFANTLN